MPGTNIFSIHHPSGDLTKFSAGTLAGYGQYCDDVDNFDRCRAPQGSYMRVHWTQGTTEGGSSGSGLYTADATGAYRLHDVEGRFFGLGDVVESGLLRARRLLATA